MPLKFFKCVDGEKVEIKDCYKTCRMGERCMSMRSLYAAGIQRKWTGKPSVTQLIKPTLESYLMIKNDYTTDPMNTVASMIGTSFHAYLDNFKPNGWLAAIRLEDDYCSGEFDAMNLIDGTLWDEKCFSAYKVAMCLGMHADWVADGTYVRGEKKGQTKWKRVWSLGGEKDIKEIALQLNKYKYLLEDYGIPVKDMKIEMFIREGLNRNAKDLGLTKAVNIIPVDTMPREEVDSFFKQKYTELMTALETDVLPPKCSDEETWNGRKCAEYCNAREFCKYVKEND